MKNRQFRLIFAILLIRTAFIYMVGIGILAGLDNIHIDLLKLINHI